MDAADRRRLLDWHQAIDSLSYYELLMVQPNASAEDVRDAFHEFALRFHPDRHPDLDGVSAHALFRVYERGVEAERVLCDSALRLRYDLALSRGRVRLTDQEISVSLRPEPPARVRIDELARSAGAKLAARQAETLIGRDDLRGARKALRQALEFDANVNPPLAARLDDLELALFARGELED